jgi:hypothetical protein
MMTLYLSQLATGYTLCLMGVPYTLLGKKFFRFHLWIPLSLFLFISLWLPWQWPELAVFGSVIVLLLFYALLLELPWNIRAKKQILLGLAGVAALGVLFYLAFLYRGKYEEHLHYSAFFCLFLHFLSSALLMGSTLVTMVLGHHYLVLPKLSFDPLKRLTRFFIFALVFRLALTLFFLGTHWDLWFSTMEMSVNTYLLKNIHLLSLRFVAGLLVPSVLAYMIWDCVKRHSNQSATGILYVACFLTMMGEFGANWYLFQEKLLL